MGLHVHCEKVVLLVTEATTFKIPKKPTLNMQAKKNHTTKPKKNLGINHPYVDGTAINAPDIIKDLMKLPPKLWMNVYVCHFK